jgi:L-seryl-tRNA(Ser) seleniumtransferase
MDEHQKELLKNLPKIDEMMLRIEKRENLAGFPREIVKEACRTVVEQLRARILREKGETLRLPTPEQAADRAAGIIEGFRSYRLRRVINATGVILHTNLGRAPLCREAMRGSSRSPGAIPTSNMTWKRGSGGSATTMSGGSSAR